MKPTGVKCLTLILLLTCPLIWLKAQEQKSYDLSTPRNAIENHLENLKVDHYFPHTARLSFSKSIESEGFEREKLAIQLEEIYNGKGIVINYDKFPLDADYTDSSNMQHQFQPFPMKFPEVQLVKNGTIWQYSNSTARSVPIIHKALYPYGSTILSNYFPPFMQEKIFNIAIWQYVAIALYFAFAGLLHMILMRIFTKIYTKLSDNITKKNNFAETKAKYLKKAGKNSSFLILLYIFKKFIPTLLLPAGVTNFVIVATSIAIVIAMTSLLYNLVFIITSFLMDYTERTESKTDEELLMIITGLVKSIIIILAIFEILRILGVNITTLIAGVSIGGLVLALAAQDAVKNLIGSFVLIADKPFVIGDWVVGSGFEGSVEHIGFRSTRIRTKDMSVTSVPNGMMSNIVIKNMGERPERLMELTIKMRYGTPMEKLQSFKEGILDIISNDSRISDQNYRVNYVNISDGSIDLQLQSNIMVRNLQDELKVKESVYYEIIELSRKLDIDIAYPTQRVIIDSNPNG